MPSYLKNGYCLRLGGNNDWHIIVDKPLKQWGKYLATIMGLPICSHKHYKKLIFTQELKDSNKFTDIVDNLKSSLDMELPAAGWKKRRIGDLWFWYHFEILVVICALPIGTKPFSDVVAMIIGLYPIYEQVHKATGLFLHGALVDFKNHGILLAGSANAGKSTSCLRLPAPWQPLCDDQTLIKPDLKGSYRAHPFPTWSEHLFGNRSNKTWNVAQSYPLKTILFIKRSPTDHVESIGEGEAAMFLYDSTSTIFNWTGDLMELEERKQLMKRLFENSCVIAKSIPCFSLKISLNGQFWKKIEKTLGF